MNRMLRTFAVLALLSSPATLRAQSDEPLSTLSLEELMDVRVVSASNTAERLSDAPATVIVITRDEMERRGYGELSEILDDLPGMDVVRPYGATYLKNYWRGYRNTIGDPFLIMVDGLVFNHLYFNTADIMATFPLTNIDRIEVVYGPASSVYGANAFMGVINIITIDDESVAGSTERLRLTTGSYSSRIADASLFYKNNDIRFSLTTRIDNGELDDAAAGRYEYTRNRYYADPKLWGGFADSSFGGRFRSPHRNRAIDARLHFGTLEIAAQYFRLDAGYGTEYAADRAQNDAVWARPDFSISARQSRPLSARVTSSTLVRYRTSDVSSDSFFVESAADAPRLIDFSFWQSRNSSVSLFQDFDVRISPRVSLTSGLKYEQKDLQKAYDVTYGPALPPSAVTAAGYPYPSQSNGSGPQNRITTEDVGLYTQAWFGLGNGTRLNLGMRLDRNSKYGDALTVRAGYVATVGAWTAKALYGEAFQEPNNRLLYGGWDGSGSDPTLDPERSRTVELSASRTSAHLMTLVSAYAVRNTDTFVNTAGGARNLGDRDVIGLDLHSQMVASRGMHDFKAWGYYSRTFRASEEKLDASGSVSGEGPIGDLARDKFHFGVSDVFRRDVTASLRGRYIGARRTVETNPLRRVPGYATADAFLRWDDAWVKGVGVSLSATNLFDRAYDHPGVRDANAGDTPGVFNEQGEWVGSRGFYNSLLPQPGRALSLNIHIDSPGARRRR